MTSPVSFGFPGAIPPGVSVADNVSRAQEFQDAHTPAETLQWFYETVRNNKDQHLPTADSMDYKQFDPAYAPFGNFNYGVVGKALGLPDWVLQYGAGYAQGRADGLNFEDAVVRSIADTKNFGDNPEDQVQIRDGIRAANDAGVTRVDPGLTDFLSQTIADAINLNWTGDTLGALPPVYHLQLILHSTQAFPGLNPETP